MNPIKFRRRAITIAVVSAVATAGLAGCTPASSTSEGDAKYEPVKIAVVTGSTSDPYFGTVAQGMEAAASDLGVTLNSFPLRNYDNLTPDTVNNLESALASQPDAIASWNVDENSLGESLDAVNAAGIPLVEFTTGVLDDGHAIAYVLPDDYAAGEAAAKAMAAEGHLTGVCVSGVAGNPSLEARCGGFTDGLESAGGTVETINLPSSNVNNPAKMITDIQGYLTNKTDIDAVFTIGSPFAAGAKEAIANLDRTDSILLGTNDMTKQILEDVKNGDMLFAIDQQPFLQGYYAIQILAQHVRYGLKPVEPVMTGPLVVTKDNVQKVIDAEKATPGIRGAS